MKRKDFVSGALSLTASMFIIRASSMAFSVFVSSKIGAEQMGLFSLIMSVFSFAETVAISGIPLAATTLVSQKDRSCNSENLLKKCLFLALTFGLGAACVLFFLAKPVSVRFLNRADAVFPIRVLSVSLPFTATSAAARGYFAGLQKIPCITAGKMVEDFSNMLIVISLMKIFGTSSNPCTILTFAISASAVLAFLCDGAMCLYSVKSKMPSPHASFKKILSVSSPVAAGTYMRSALNAAENIMIPSALSSNGTSDALASYGTVRGMAFPILTFPYVVLQSFISLLIPEISGRYARENKKSVVRASKTALRATFCFACVVSGVLLIYGRKMGFFFYNNYPAGTYITALALLAVPMYIDSVTDAILKGLGQQVFCLKINIADSCVRLVLIWFLVPRMGIFGYIAVMYISELINLTLSAGRLKKFL